MRADGIRWAFRPLSAFCFLVLAFLGFSAAARAQALEPLVIETSAGPRRFEVEVARSEADREQGLMYRRHMAETNGMLFDFGQVAPVSMWMKNTYLSLDMVFIRADGVIARVAERTEPLSTRIVSSGGPVLSVLELAGGAAQRFGIKDGDRVVHPLFRPR